MSSRFCNLTHGSATMLVWGPILGNMNPTRVQDKQPRISNLAHCLEKHSGTLTAGGQVAPGMGHKPEGANDQGEETGT